MRKRASFRGRKQPLGTLNVALDVDLARVHLVTDFGDGIVRREVDNRSAELQLMCQWLKRKASVGRYSGVRLVVEPTGIYHELLFRIAGKFGFETRLVQAEAVKKNRVVMFGDYGKTDRRDPEVIFDLAHRGRLIRHRVLPEVFQALRNAGIIYARAERDGVRAKNRIHRGRRRVFPDFPMSKDFLFSRSGDAVMKVTGLDPHQIISYSSQELDDLVRAHAPRIHRRSVERIHRAAELSAESIPASPGMLLTVLELRQAWDDLLLAEDRKKQAAEILLELYDQARELDPNLPDAQPGLVSKLNLARLVAETGPWSHFDSIKELMKYIGLNLFENESGKFRGKRKISKKGRGLARHVLTQIVVPLVRRGRLLADFHRQKKKVEKKPGPVAITASARKTIKILFGWGRSGQQFDVNRVFTCESQLPTAA